MDITIIKHGVPIKVEITEKEYQDILRKWTNLVIYTINNILILIPIEWSPELRSEVISKAIKPFHYFLQEELERRYDNKSLL